MMALATQQGCYTPFQLRTSSWGRGIKFKQSATTLHIVGRTNKFISLKSKTCSSIGAPIVLKSKTKCFKISAFKGIDPEEESVGRTWSNCTKDSVKLSYKPQENGRILSESRKVESLSLSQTSETEKVIGSSLAVQHVLGSWLALLLTPTQNQTLYETLNRESLWESEKIKNGMKNKERDEILKAAWCFILGLDASVKMPLLIFIPWYLTVRMMFGAEVSKELTPLWIFGPAIVCLYVKMLHGLCSLYAFSIKQTIVVFRNLPTYYMMGSNYITCRQLKNSKELREDLEEWWIESCLDFMEQVWPYYFRANRILKRSHLI